jgi:hypothetical protein
MESRIKTSIRLTFSTTVTTRMQRSLPSGLFPNEARWDPTAFATRCAKNILRTVISEKSADKRNPHTLTRCAALDERAERSWGVGRRSRHVVSKCEPTPADAANESSRTSPIVAYCRDFPNASWARASHLWRFMPYPDPDSSKRAAIVAKSLHRELREGGFTNEELLRLATELLGLVTSDLRRRDAAVAG